MLLTRRKHCKGPSSNLSERFREISLTALVFIICIRRPEAGNWWAPPRRVRHTAACNKQFREQLLRLVLNTDIRRYTGIRHDTITHYIVSPTPPILRRTDAGVCILATLGRSAVHRCEGSVASLSCAEISRAFVQVVHGTAIKLSSKFRESFCNIRIKWELSKFADKCPNLRWAHIVLTFVIFF